MFSVLFDVHPRPDRWDTYLGYAALLRPELERIDGFVDNVRYRSLTRDGWLLSLSGWRDEKSLVRWRTQATHHGIQQRARAEVFAAQLLLRNLREVPNVGRVIATVSDQKRGVLREFCAGSVLMQAAKP